MDKKLLIFVFIGIVIALSILLYLVSFKITGRAMVSYTCNDTDEGKNYYVQGNVTITGTNKFVRRYLDSCSSGRLFERSCNKDGTLQTTTYKCPNGCNRGVCISSTAISNLQAT